MGDEESMTLPSSVGTVQPRCHPKIRPIIYPQLPECISIFCPGRTDAGQTVIKDLSLAGALAERLWRE
jgi:hypothetical protein